MNKRVVGVVVISLVFLGLLILSSQIFNVSNTYIPDFLQNDFFSDIMADHGDLRYTPPLDGINVSSKLVGFRGAKLSPEGEIVPGAMIGYIFVLGALKLVSEKIVFILYPLLFLLSVYFFYKTARLYFSKGVSYLLSGFFMFNSAIIFYVFVPHNNFLSLFLTLAGIYFLLKYSIDKNISNLAIFIILAFFDFIVRTPSLLIYLVAIAFVFFTGDRKVHVKSVIKLMPLILVLISAFFLLYWSLYGGFSGFLPGSDNSFVNSNYFFKDRPQAFFSWLPFLSFSILKQNTLNYFILLFPLITLLSVISIFSVLNSSSKNRQGIVLFSLLVLVGLFYYAGGIFTGFDLNFPNIGLGASYPRYLLPSYSFAIILAGFYISKNFENRKKLFWQLVLFFYVIMNILFLVNSYASLTYVYESQAKFQMDKETILSQIPESNAIVFTVYYDKILFPERMTALYSGFPEENRVNLVMAEIDNLLSQGVPVYFMLESKRENYDSYALEDYTSVIEKNYDIETSENVIKIIKKK